MAPGITAVRVGGHAPGQLVFEVAGEHGPIVLASDAIHYDDELELERPFGIFTTSPTCTAATRRCGAMPPPAPRSSRGTIRP